MTALKGILIGLLLIGCESDQHRSNDRGMETGNQTPSEFNFPDSEMVRLNDVDLQRVEPFRIFDNLYYVGVGWVSCYVLDTGGGLVLIDALYGDFVEMAIENIKKVGLDPVDIEYVLATHGHFDHVGGAALFQRRFGSRIAMTGADWQLAIVDAKGRQFPFDAPEPGMVLDDGDSLKVGDTMIKFYVTPGHTEGVLSMEFPVRDGDTEHRAFVFGGVGLNFSGVSRTQSYIESVRRIQDMMAEPHPIQVNISNHPGPGQIFDRRDRLRVRQEGDPHPYVDPEGYRAWLDQLLRDAEEKLETERAAARN